MDTKEKISQIEDKQTARELRRTERAKLRAMRREERANLRAERRNSGGKNARSERDTERD
jgi:hypothetical protein